MSRQARIIVPGCAHHVTQRGNRRQLVFFSEDDRFRYLALVNKYFEKFSVELLAYCLMSNHVHLIAVPTKADGLHHAFKSIHRQYAFEMNLALGWCGHFWQERFFSSPLDDDHLWNAIRYVELNPVRAGIVSRPYDYEWSSALAHCGLREDRNLTKSSEWAKKLGLVKNWAAFLDSPFDKNEESNLRQRFSRGLPCGTGHFIQSLERMYRRQFIVRSAGRPRSTRTTSGS